MRHRPPQPRRVGPLTISLKRLERGIDLLPLAGSLPAGQPVVWLDSARVHPVTGRWSILAWDPWLTCRVSGDQVEIRTSASTTVRKAHPLEALRALLNRYRLGDRDAAALGAAARPIGLLGYLSYDMNRWIERLPAPQPSAHALPEMLWFGMRRTVLVDHADDRSWLISVADPHGPSGAARREAAQGIEQLEALLHAEPSADRAALPWTAGPIEATSSQPAFEAMVARALAQIRAGDIYQANISQRFLAPWSGDPLALYARLRAINPSPFACFLAWDDAAIVSCSPERLVRVQDGWVDTRPIAGTRPRGGSADEDAMQSLELLLSEKERAEHVMLVDLARNDLGRISAPGTVVVNELIALEHYSHVMHIVSDVAGRLAPGADLVDAIRAVFPGGTITGCPKVRCMQILREVEPVARGLYTGSVGYLGFSGMMDLNIAIRTMVLQGGRLSYHAGAGIVADSDPSREYQETLAKAAALERALAPASGAQAPGLSGFAEVPGHAAVR